jgi:predicted metal-dependent enzyme (double-stranded beta helix superfamily)
MSFTSSAPVRGSRSPTVSQLGGASSVRHSPPAFSAVPRPRGRDLSAPELETFVAELAERPELWIDLVQHDSTERHYEELLRDEHLTAWLICWLEDHDTGFHDHDVSSGAVAVVGGAVREERLVIDGPSRDRVLCAGETFHFSPSDIHRVTHAGSGPPVSLHVYSPPLLRMGAYVIGEDGVLGRRPMSNLEELRSLARPAAS